MLRSGSTPQVFKCLCRPEIPRPSSCLVLVLPPVVSRTDSHRNICPRCCRTRHCVLPLSPPWLPLGIHGTGSELGAIEQEVRVRIPPYTPADRPRYFPFPPTPPHFPSSTRSTYVPILQAPSTFHVPPPLPPLLGITSPSRGADANRDMSKARSTGKAGCGRGCTSVA